MGVANPDPETTYYNYDRAAELGTGVARLLSGIMIDTHEETSISRVVLSLCDGLCHGPFFVHFGSIPGKGCGI